MEEALEQEEVVAEPEEESAVKLDAEEGRPL